MTTLVRPEPRDDSDPEWLLSRVAALEATLDERSADVAGARADLDAFRIAYRHRVGTLHEQLDKLELAIAEAELGELAKRLGAGPAEPAPAAPGTPREVSPRYTSDGIRKLFRDVAKAIHPDLAEDEATRHRRHALMIAANRAYALSDEAQLRSILHAWERSPEAVQGSDPEATRLRLVRRVAQIEDELTLLAGDLEALKASPSWQLKAMVEDAAAQGKDLIRDTVVRLKRDIMAATNRLDAMRGP